MKTRLHSFQIISFAKEQYAEKAICPWSIHWPVMIFSSVVGILSARA